MEMIIPNTHYGVLEQNFPASDLESAAEQISNLGFAVLDGGYDASELKAISDDFERTRQQYIEEHGKDHLRNIGELHTVRAPLTRGGKSFLQLALNQRLLTVVNMLIPGQFILNQQNGVINPPQESYSQGAWHRDLPYQHFVSSRPLAVNALFCVDEFTLENGATFVLPASHKAEPLPSVDYIARNAMQVTAPAGNYILLDCMLFHSGGFNRTKRERRAVNHVFNIPFFKQQINIPMNMRDVALTEEQRKILGFGFSEPATVANYLASRSSVDEVY